MLLTTLTTPTAPTPANEMVRLSSPESSVMPQRWRISLAESMLPVASLMARMFRVRSQALNCLGRDGHAAPARNVVEHDRKVAAVGNGHEVAVDALLRWACCSRA
jgi:hypothetical protein